jgi:hypothetical protein
MRRRAARRYAAERKAETLGLGEQFAFHPAVSHENTRRASATTASAACAWLKVVVSSVNWAAAA